MAQPRIEMMLNAVTADGSSKIVETRGHSLFSHQIITTGTTSGTVKLQGSNDGVNWEDIASDAINSATSTFQHSVSSTGQRSVYRYLRVNLSSRTNGTFTSHLWMTGHGGQDL